MRTFLSLEPHLDENLFSFFYPQHGSTGENQTVSLHVCFCSYLKTTSVCCQDNSACTHSGTTYLTIHQLHIDSHLSCNLHCLPGAWQPLISIWGLQQGGNGLLFRDNVKYNVPLYSWKLLCPDSLIAVGNNRCQDYEQLPNRCPSALRCWFTVES